MKVSVNRVVGRYSLREEKHVRGSRKAGMCPSLAIFWARSGSCTAKDVLEKDKVHLFSFPHQFVGYTIDNRSRAMSGLIDDSAVQVTPNAKLACPDRPSGDIDAVPFATFDLDCGIMPGGYLDLEVVTLLLRGICIIRYHSLTLERFEHVGDHLLAQCL